MIEVRRAGPADAAVLGEIHAAAWEAVYAPFFAPDFAARAVEDRRHRWHARVGGGSETVLLASVDGRPLALSFFAPSPTGPASPRSSRSTATPTAGAAGSPPP